MSFTIVTYDRQNIFIIQATVIIGHKSRSKERKGNRQKINLSHCGLGRKGLSLTTFLANLLGESVTKKKSFFFVINGAKNICQDPGKYYHPSLIFVGDPSSLPLE